MSDPLETLATIAAALQRNDRKRDQLLAERDHSIIKARSAGSTWRAIALTLGMTEHGVIKAVKARARKDGQA